MDPFSISPRRQVKSIPLNQSVPLESTNSTSANSINLINSINSLKMDQFSKSEYSDPFFSPFPSPPPPAPGMLPGMPPAPTMLALPPLATYPTKDALYEAIQKWAKDRGYAFTIQRSRTLGNGRQKVQYACDRCPPVQRSSSTERSRETQSRGTGCLFSIIAVNTPSLGWEVKYRPEAKFNTHNHPPSQSPAAHPSHRHLAIQAQAITRDLFNAGKSLYIIY
jgi:hypothetical protein